MEAQITKLVERAHREKTQRFNELNNFGTTRNQKVTDAFNANFVNIEVTSTKASANGVQRAAKRSKMGHFLGYGEPKIPDAGAKVKINEEVARALKEDLQKFLNIPVVHVQNITVNNFSGEMSDN